LHDTDSGVLLRFLAAASAFVDGGRRLGLGDRLGSGAGLGPWASPSPVPDSRGARPLGATRRVPFPLRGATSGRAPRQETMVAGRAMPPTVTRWRGASGAAVAIRPRRWQARRPRRAPPPGRRPAAG